MDDFIAIKGRYNKKKNYEIIYDDEMRALLTQVGTIPTSRLHILLLPSYYTKAERKLPRLDYVFY